MNPYLLNKMVEHTQRDIARARSQRSWRELLRTRQS
jgi:hypothetical protein